jgi:hypothetical protein
MHLKKIERFTGQPIKAHTVEGMEPKFKPRPASSAPRSGAPRGNGGGYAGRNSNGGGYAGRSNNGSNFSRHAAPDSRHEHSQDQRREGHKHSRFTNDAPRSGNPNGNVNGNVSGNRAPAHHAPSHHAPAHRAAAPHTAAPHAAPRRPQGTSFSLGRGNNSNPNGNKR